MPQEKMNWDVCFGAGARDKHRAASHGMGGELVSEPGKEGLAQPLLHKRFYFH